MTAATAAALPEPGRSVLLHIAESVAMYGGGVTLYGFLTPSDKAMFLTFRDCVPGTGAKKALEYLDKASKSLPDFRRAVLDKDAKVLTGVFGFTRKTADGSRRPQGRDRGGQVPGAERLARAGGASAGRGHGPSLERPGRPGLQVRGGARRAVAVAEEHPGEALDAERIIRLALKRL